MRVELRVVVLDTLAQMNGYGWFLGLKPFPGPASAPNAVRGGRDAANEESWPWNCCLAMEVLRFAHMVRNIFYIL